MRTFLSTFAKGLAMGAANVIPGVSGGTIAFITGIYERLVRALSHFDLKALKMLIQGKLGDFSRHVDLGFLAALGLGVVIAVLGLAGLLKWAFTEHPVLVWAFFFGLIAASTWSVVKMVKQWRGAVVGMLILGMAIAAALGFLSPGSENSNPFYLVICGVVGACSMILPGISGSFVLLLMGNYELVMLDGVNALRGGEINEALKILVPVGLGAVLGLGLLARLLSWLFKRFHDLAVGLIGGFVAGSLVAIWPWKVPGEVQEFVKPSGEVKEKILSWDFQLPDWGSSQTWWAFGFIVLGGLVALAIDIWGQAEGKRTQREAEQLSS